MRNTIQFTASLAVLGFALAGCGGGSTVLTPPHPVQSNGAPVQYTQIERLSRPAIKEVFEPFQDHQKSNVAEPYNDPVIQNDIKFTEDTVRPPVPATGSSVATDYGALLQKVLYPDEMLVNLNGGPPTGVDKEYFLSTEATNGAAFGGRQPNDDVIDLELGIIFGNTLSALGLQPDDHQENNCLAFQNIGGPGQAVYDPSIKSSGTFPYFAGPH